MTAMFANNIRIMHRRPSIDAFNQVLVHLTKQLQRRRFLEIGQSEKKNVCGGHVCLRIGTKSAFFIENLPIFCVVFLG
jgi:hypothetical protein